MTLLPKLILHNVLTHNVLFCSYLSPDVTTTRSTCVATDTEFSHNQHRALSNIQSPNIVRSEEPHSSVSSRHRHQVVTPEEPTLQSKTLPKDRPQPGHQQDHGAHRRPHHRVHHDVPAPPLRHHRSAVSKLPGRRGLHQPGHLESLADPGRPRGYPGHHQRGEERQRQIRREQCPGPLVKPLAVGHHTPAETPRHDFWDNNHRDTLALLPQLQLQPHQPHHQVTFLTSNPPNSLFFAPEYPAMSTYDRPVIEDDDPRPFHHTGTQLQACMCQTAAAIFTADSRSCGARVKIIHHIKPQSTSKQASSMPSDIVIY